MESDVMVGASRLSSQRRHEPRIRNEQASAAETLYFRHVPTDWDTPQHLGISSGATGGVCSSSDLCLHSGAEVLGCYIQGEILPENALDTVWDGSPSAGDSQHLWQRGRNIQ